MFEELLVEVTAENCENHLTGTTLSKLLEWQQNGGNITLEQIRLLPNEEREVILDYLKEFATLEIVDVGNKTFILVHSGFSSFDPRKDIYDYTPRRSCFHTT